MKTEDAYMDGQPAMLFDLVVYAEALHVVEAIHAKEEEWVREMGFAGDLRMLAGITSCFGFERIHDAEDLVLLARLSESEAMSILYPHPGCGGSLRIDAVKAKGLMQAKGIAFKEGWLDPQYHVGGGGIAP